MALADLLDKESALLQKIDRLKTVASEENRDKSILRLLDNVRKHLDFDTIF